jgi:general secretion pathway protein M
MMLRTKQPVLSTAGKHGAAYVAAFMLVSAILAVAPFVLAHSLKAEISEQEGMISLLNKRMEKAAKGSAVGSLDKLEAANFLIHGETAGIAAAEMQRKVAAVADASGLRISRMQSVNVSQNGGAVALQLELEATGKIEGLQKFLYALESGKPFVFVKDANISVAGAAEASAEAELPSVRITLEAAGWIGGI